MRSINCPVLASLAVILVAQCLIASSEISPSVTGAAYTFGSVKSIHDALAKLEIKKDSDPAEIMAKVRQLAESDEKHRKIYKALLVLVDHKSMQELKPLTELWKRIDGIPRVGAETASIKDNFDFFEKHFGQTKMNELASLVEDKFSKIGKLEVLESFDSVFRAALNEKNKIEDTDEAYLAWCDKLKNFKLHADDMRVPKMLATIEQVDPNVAQAAPSGLHTFMNNQCGKLDEFSLELDIVNLAKDNSAIRSVTLRRANEYYKICSAWRDDLKRISRNVYEQMTVAGRLGRKVDSNRKYQSAKDVVRGAAYSAFDGISTWAGA